MGSIRKSRLPRYAVVGATAYFSEMFCLLILIRILDFKPVTAVAISFWVGFVIAFSLQKLITFKNYERKPKALAWQIISYCALVTWNYGFSLALIRLFAPKISAFVVRTVAIIVIASWNYVLYHYIFKTGSIIGKIK